MQAPDWGPSWAADCVSDQAIVKAWSTVHAALTIDGLSVPWPSREAFAAYIGPRPAHSKGIGRRNAHKPHGLGNTFWQGDASQESRLWHRHLRAVVKNENSTATIFPGPVTMANIREALAAGQKLEEFIKQAPEKPLRNHESLQGLAAEEITPTGHKRDMVYTNKLTS